MQTKCFVNILLTLSIISFAGCSDDDKHNSKERLPETAQAFIESRLPGYKILNIEEVDDKEDEINEKYIVTFSDDILVSFSSLGYWRRIKSSSELPELIQEVIPFGGAAVIKETFPITTINEINFTLYGCQVVPNNGLPIAFYDIGSSNKFGLDLTKEVYSWPENATEFLKAYYIEPLKYQVFYFIQENEDDGSEYCFGTSGGGKVNFDKEGNWYSCDRGSWNIPNRMYKELLPQEMRNIIETKYKSGASSTYGIMHRNTYYQAMLKQASGNYIWVMFDTTTNQEVKVPEETILDFLKTYVGEPAKDTNFNTRIVGDTKQVVFQITGEISGVNVLTMHTDTTGKMLSFNLNGSVIPDKILTYLPVKVQEYAEENYAGKEIMLVMNGLGGEYYILYKKSPPLYFDKEGNVII